MRTSRLLWAEAQQEAGGQEADERGDSGGEDEDVNQPPGRELRGVTDDADDAGEDGEAERQERGQTRPADATREEQHEREQDAGEIEDEKDDKQHATL
jgi:hypothetical protein